MVRVLLADSEAANDAPHDHAVHVYADDRAINHELNRFIEDGLILGEGVVVAANEQHRAVVTAWRSGLTSIGADENLLLVDAAQTLRAFMVDGCPDVGRFEATVGALVDRAAQGGRRVRVFGEMVALLWADGNVAGALALESMWNALAATRPFFLLCGYPEPLLDEAPLRAVNAMCERHSNLSLLGHLSQFAAAAPATPPMQSRRLLIPVPTAVPTACQVARRTLVEWRLSGLIENCVIVTSELASNAVLHARSPFRLTFTRTSRSLRIAVEDASLSLPASGPEISESMGSGLTKVASIASDFGCDLTQGGKTVWAELAL